MECESLYSRVKEQYERLMKYYLDNNDQSFCARLTYTYVILGMITRTFEELETIHAHNIDAYYKFIGLVAIYMEKLDSCGSQRPERVCIAIKKCTGMSCTKAYEIHSPDKMISLLEQCRAEMFKFDHDLCEPVNHLHATP